jgi:hypothetical protein
MDTNDADKECVRSLTREKCALTAFKKILVSNVLPALISSARRGEIEREQYNEVISKFDKLENEFHMLKQEENLEEGIEMQEKLEEGIRKLEKVREEAEASLLKAEMAMLAVRMMRR